MNGTKTEYLLNGTQILAQKTGSDVMWFFYDSTGTRIGVQQVNVTAYYMYNLQGDVVGLLGGVDAVAMKVKQDVEGLAEVPGAGVAVGVAPALDEVSVLGVETSLA